LKSYLILKPESRPPLPPELREHVDVRDPRALIEYFLREFTQEGDRVFDPFAGLGTALEVAQAMNRVPYGIEYDPQRLEYARSQLRQPNHLIHGDARELASYPLQTFHLSISSPPFMRKNDREDPLSAYTNEGRGYEQYLRDVREVYRQVGSRMVDGGRVVILVANLKSPDGLTPLAWDVAREVSNVLSFQGEVVVIPEEGFAFGYDHYYCLIFARQQGSPSGNQGEERALPGNVSSVAQVGDTIHRSTGPWSPAVHAVLEHLERVGFGGAPRFRGIDEQGREVLTRLEGYAPPEANLPFITEERLAAVGRLVRELHEALAGFRLPPGVEWHRRIGSAEGEGLPICHLDIHPPNIVFRDGEPIGCIDWDLTGPAPHAWEIARAAWLLVPLSPDARCRAKGWSEPPDRFGRLRLFCDAYCLDAAARQGFAHLAMRMAQTCADQVSAAAADGVPSARWLVEDVGYLRIVDRDIDWMREAAAAIDDALE
jgi:DNA methylase/Phosphotransferase enzyme family